MGLNGLYKNRQLSFLYVGFCHELNFFIELNSLSSLYLVGFATECFQAQTVQEGQAAVHTTHRGNHTFGVSKSKMNFAWKMAMPL